MTQDPEAHPETTAAPAQAAVPAASASQPRPPLWARWWGRRHRIADWVLAAMFFPWTGVMLIGPPYGLGGPVAVVGGLAAALLGDLAVYLAIVGAVMLALLAAGVSFVVLFRRSQPLLLLWAAVAALVCYGDFGLPALALFTYAAWFDQRRRLAVWTAWLSGCFLIVYTLGEPSYAQSVFLLIMCYGMPLMAGLWIGTRRALIANLRERAARLEREQHLLADQAISAERTRIAREMHDVVAHRVSLMVLHAGGLEVSASDERTAEGAALIRNTGRDALSELREILGVLRDDPEAGAPTAPQPLLADLTRLVSEWSSAGMPVTESSTGTPAALAAQTERTVYRVVQEALTNAAKHAPGAGVRVHLDYRPDTLEITVENAPPPAPAADPPPSSGYGLAGLRERISLVGGTLRTGPRLDGGWRVTAVLPATRAERGQRQEAAE